MSRRLIFLLCALMMLLSFPLVHAETVPETSGNFEQFYRIPDVTAYQGDEVIRGYLKGASTTVEPLALSCRMTRSAVVGQTAAWRVTVTGGLSDPSCRALLFRQELDAADDQYAFVASISVNGGSLQYAFTEEGRYFWELRVIDEGGEFCAFQTDAFETCTEAEAAAQAEAFAAEERASASNSAQGQAGLFEGHVELLIEGEFPTQGMGRANRGDLTGFNATILEGLESLATEIDLSDYPMTSSEFRLAYRTLLNSHPELFYVSSGYSFYFDGTYVTGLLPKYKYTADELPEKVAMFNRELNKIVNYANRANTTVGKLLLASDYMCVHFEYDYPAFAIHSPEEMFEKGRGVCQAYTMIYSAVCNRLGIENTTASSDAMNHTWNLVKVNGSWYHVDVTWNDPIADAPYRAMHNNFLRSDEGIAAEGHYNWVTSVTATNTKYDNYFWNDIDHAVSLRGNLIYFTPHCGGYPEGRICTGNIANGEVKDALSYKVKLSGSYYPDMNPVWATSDAVYFSMADTVYSMPLSGGTPKAVFSANDRSEYLAYFYLSGSTMYVTARSLKNYNSTTVYSFRLSNSATVELDAERCALEIGDALQLTYTTDPADTDAAVTWSSSDESVAAVGSDGLVAAVGAGTATVTVQLGSSTDTCTIIVTSNKVALLPPALQVIEDEAFEDCTWLTFVKIPNKVTHIGEEAFAECTNLAAVRIPASVTYIGEDAFEDCPLQYAEVAPGSYAEEWLLRHFPDIYLAY